LLHTITLLYCTSVNFIR